MEVSASSPQSTVNPQPYTLMQKAPAPTYIRLSPYITCFSGALWTLRVRCTWNGADTN